MMEKRKRVKSIKVVKVQSPGGYPGVIVWVRYTLHGEWRVKRTEGFFCVWKNPKDGTPEEVAKSLAKTISNWMRKEKVTNKEPVLMEAFILPWTVYRTMKKRLLAACEEALVKEPARRRKLDEAPGGKPAKPRPLLVKDLKKVRESLKTPDGLPFTPNPFVLLAPAMMGTKLPVAPKGRKVKSKSSHKNSSET